MPVSAWATEVTKAASGLKERDLEEANSRFPYTFGQAHADNLERIDQLRARQHPVGLAPATTPAARQSDVQFRMLHRECLTPIRQKRWCPVHDVEVGPDEIVRGWEVAKGEFVPVEDAELEAIESHETSRAIEITRFVPAADVDPIYFDRTYYLVPAGDRGAAPALRPARSRRCARRGSPRSARSCSPARRSSA